MKMRLITFISVCLSISAQAAHRALLVGCSNVEHPGTGLAGNNSRSYNTLNKVVDRLQALHLGFDIERLSDDPHFGYNPAVLPTADNIKRALRRRIHESQPGDTLLFVYNGHGDDRGWDWKTQRRRQYLCCIGSNDSEFLWDNELHEILNTAHAGVKILVLLDCCHAGYIASQPYRFSSSWSPRKVGGGSRSQRFLAR
jgi:hypothetical protein